MVSRGYLPQQFQSVDPGESDERGSVGDNDHDRRSAVSVAAS